MRPFKSISEYATSDVIIRLLAKERGKYASKNTGCAERHDSMYVDQLKPLMPPRSVWVNAGKKRRPKSGKNVHGIALWTRKKKLATARVYVTICKEMDCNPESDWVINLKAFIERIQEILDGSRELKLESPVTVAKFKEHDSKTGDFIYRPICAYTSLETKIILALTYNYLLYCFDDCFHRNMLFMRSARRAEGGSWKSPNYLDAIRLADSYRKRNDSELIFVGECDIQKFYDIFNHDDIIECFEKLFEIKKGQQVIPDESFDPIRRVVKAYLDSYNYMDNVMCLNDSDDFWQKERKIHATPQNPKPVCRFKWVSEEQFVESGCYSSVEEFRRVRDAGKIGIPQGGALSGMIVNVVMNEIDKGIVEPHDPGRFFVRYCDDILLMHTDRCMCRRYLDYYVEALKRHKLVPHKLEQVSQSKNGVKTSPHFWHVKSKHVFLWGHGCGDASDWVGFVGFEMRRTGEIRVRKDKVNSEARRIAKTYYSVIKSKSPEDRIGSFNSLAGHIRDYEMVTTDRYTLAQAKHLDNYLKKKVCQASKKTGVPVPENLRLYYRELINKVGE